MGRRYTGERFYARNGNWFQNYFWPDSTMNVKKVMALIDHGRMLSSNKKRNKLYLYSPKNESGFVEDYDFIIELVVS